eukprot:PITA_18643
MNRTVQQMAHAMLDESRIPTTFLGEAAFVVVTILNQANVRVNSTQTPHEICYGKTPTIKYFKVFGSKCYIKRTDEKLGKFEPRADEDQFPSSNHTNSEEETNEAPKEEITIEENTPSRCKRYRLIPLKSKNVIIRRDVKFSKKISVYEPSSTDVPPLSIPSTSENISSSDDDSEDDNPPPPSQDPPSAPQLPKWVCAIQDAAGALTGDSIDQRSTHSQFDRASSLLAQGSANYDPDTFIEALGHPNWDATMNEEYRPFLANDTLNLVSLPKGRKLVRCKWVYRTKYGPNGKVDKHKAHLVAKGFSQVEGIEYIETFSLVAKMNSIRLVLSLAASFKWEVHQMDVKFAFLHGDLHE